MPRSDRFPLNVIGMFFAFLLADPCHWMWGDGRVHLLTITDLCVVLANTAACDACCCMVDVTDAVRLDDLYAWHLCGFDLNA